MNDEFDKNWEEDIFELIDDFSDKYVNNGNVTSSMSNERYDELMKSDSELKLTQEEINKGYHFCVEWDGLLIGHEMMEFDFCSCFPTPKVVT